MDGNMFFALVDLDAQQHGLLGNFAEDFDVLIIQGLGYQAGELEAPEHHAVANNIAPAPPLVIPAVAAPHLALPAVAAPHLALPAGPAPLVVAGDLHGVVNADQAVGGDEDDENKNAWVFVGPRLRAPRIGPPVRQEIPEPEERVCSRYVVWVQDGRSIRTMCKSSMARKSGMTSTPDGEDAILAYGSYGPNGLEY